MQYEKSIALLSVALVLNMYTESAKAQSTVSTASTRNNTTIHQRAAEGEKVWVIINHVKADKRQQFERFVNELFWPMASKLGTEEQKVFRQTRVLHPTKAEADGTFSYLFIMDPVIEGGDYNIEALLKKMYSAEKAAEYNRLFEDTQASEQTSYMTTQSRY
jgi:hypothetical protein